MLNHQPKLAISADFLDAFSRIPRQIQGKVNVFVEKFKKDPTSSGINYESINGRDSRLKSVRIDLSYRAIVFKPDKGNTYILLWVDNHDDAYSWAQRRVCKINPESGALQIIDIEEASAIEAEISSRRIPQIPGRFDSIPDKYLLRLGIPDELLGAVRAVVTDEDIDKLVSKLPEEAADALLMLGAGYSIEETLTAQDKNREQTIDTDNIDAALEKDDSKRRFRVVENETELLEILAAPLEKWRVFLHPSQRRLVERDWKGPVRVLGGAGTGKTVVAMHRAKWLAENRFTNSGDRILFTTFTRNLAVDIEANLRKICSPETMRRIRVENIDAWVTSFLKSEGVTTKIVYDDQVAELWEKAYECKPESPSLTLAFYQDEWREVIQANKITNLKQYLTVTRTGRGTRLNRAERAAIWVVFEEYRSLLQQKGWKEAEDAMRDACSLLQNKPGETLPFKAVIVDEAQDMSDAVFSLIRAIVPPKNDGNDIFIVGDPHQRIYGRKVVLSRCGIDIRGRSHKLRINYRTTDETRKWATMVLDGITFDDLDGEQDDLKGYRSLLHGDQPVVKGFSSFEDEMNFISTYLQQLESSGTPLSNVCIVVRTNSLVKQYASALENLNVKVREIKRTQPDNLSEQGVRIATMHRVKGLQFDYVVLASINDGILPLKSALSNTADKAAYNSLINSERSLIHVAATRAKRCVTLTYYGQSSCLIPVTKAIPLQK
ncbi:MULTISPECIES: UvrD-helicase domain-containing protein [Calothrix]|uniref:DNA 3'-5' helicase n=2 Tax=Calothrix TaxID=1186 RepID=A0ABR8A709_9CYAN|nr:MULTISPECIES: UvrD-helicase domain-containing protein [Calothrix]MBD2195659.1 AAA family ATPase [Calothrix parietina FACHB-288]MBD2224314.1 AAA family ATPase [Calothrix anomala FACHB-343]